MPENSYDKVRQLSVTKIHITNVNSLTHNLIKPGLAIVIQAFEIIRANIGQMLTRTVDNAQIYKGTGTKIHDREHP